jgi:hypothetical protein
MLRTSPGVAAPPLSCGRWQNIKTPRIALPRMSDRPHLSTPMGQDRELARPQVRVTAYVLFLKTSGLPDAREKAER